MHLDISRDSFDPNNPDPKIRHLQVFHEQGRILLDAVLNQQIASMLHEVRTLATDMYGSHWGPGDFVNPADHTAGVSGAFKVQTPMNDNFEVLPGNYYVGGYRCQCPTGGSFRNQPFVPLILESDNDLPTKPYVVYLEVWERLLTDASAADLKDPALEQFDAPSASQVVWQIRVKNVTQAPSGPPADPFVLKDPNDVTQGLKNLEVLLGDSVEKSTGQLRVMPVQGVAESPAQLHADLCESEIDERYRGLENQLYRIEIHRSGLAYGKASIPDKTSEASSQCATFKWSRDNGSVIFPILEWTPANDYASVRLARAGRDARFSLKAGDWVEYHDEVTILRNDLAETSDRSIFRKLIQVQSVDAYDPTLITLKGTSGDFDLPQVPSDWKSFQDRRAFLRRWDQQNLTTPLTNVQQILDSKDPIQSPETNGLLVVAAPDDSDEKALEPAGWLEIEHSIRIRFSAGYYRRGDYWLIPARYASGRVLWPTKLIDPNNPNSGLIPMAQAPRTIEHHYAPLAVVTSTSAAPIDCRRIVTPERLPPQAEP
jgi:hypothetical protein